MSKNKETSDKLKIPDILAFSRKLEPSDGLFFSGKWDERANAEPWEPIPVCSEMLRATKSSYGETNPEQSNPQPNEFAALPPYADTLKVEFTLRVHGGAAVPSVCGDGDGRIAKRIGDIVAEYKDRFGGFSELAKRYAHNLATGRFLWRNRIGPEEIEIRIVNIEKGKQCGEWIFDAKSRKMNNFTESGPDDRLSELVDLISQALSDKGALLKVEAFVRLGNTQQVFPSQEMIMKEKRGEKGKVLYRVKDIAAFHSQKIGNAIRTIDTWYEDYDDSKGNGPISVEPFGSVTTKSRAFRKDGKRDFYSLFKEWICNGNPPPLEGDQHYVIATLIRGGVFGQKGD